MQTIRVFISATSADLASYRTAVKEVLIKRDIHPIEQTDFPPDFRTIYDLLYEKINTCHAFICLIGFAFGAEPSDHPSDQLRRSYTQLEYDIAQKLHKPIYIFLANKDCIFDSPLMEDPARQQLQLAHRAAILHSNQRIEEFLSIERLRERIAYIVFPDPSHKSNEPPIDSSKYDNNPNLNRAKKHLPYLPLGSLFKGREQLINKLRDELTTDFYLTRIVDSRKVLCGLAGIGKTRLAVEYAWKYETEYSAILLIVADSRENLRRDLASLTGPMILHLSGVDKGTEDDRMAAAINWLADHPCWCMILDTVDSKSAQEAVFEILPHLSGGHVLITSRLSASEWSSEVEPLDIDVLTPEDSKSFLLERTKNRRQTPTDDADAADLAKELGGLSLALEQSGAFINKTPKKYTLGEYLKLWKVGEERVQTWDKKLTHYQHSIVVTLDMTMNQISPEACALLKLLCWFAPNPIPDALVLTPLAINLLKELTANNKNSTAHLDTEEPLDELFAYSLVRRLENESSLEDEPCFSLHCVVKEITRYRIRIKEWNDMICKAIQIFIDFAPKESYRFDSWKSWHMLISHGEMLWQYSKGRPDAVNIRDKGISREEWNTDLLDALALYYMGQDRYKEAIPLQRLTLDLKTERILRINSDLLDIKNYSNIMHDNTISDDTKKNYKKELSNLFLSKNDLALMLDETFEKETLFRDALDGRFLVHGEESEEVGETLHNYSCFLRSIDNLVDAEKMSKKSLDIHTKVNGFSHWRTLMAEYSLSSILWNKGETETALNMLRENMNKKIQYLAKHHTDTLEDMSQMSYYYELLKKYDKAEILHRDLVQESQEAFGRGNNKTFLAMRNLAHNLFLQDRKEEAINLLHDIIHSSEQLYGPNHPDVSDTLCQLAEFHKSENQDDKAESLLLKALEIREKAYGELSSDTISILKNLAAFYQSIGKNDNAEKLYNKVLENTKKTVGDKHKDISKSLNNLAVFYYKQERYIEAEKLYLQSLEIEKESSRENYPISLKTMENLAILYEKQNKYSESEFLLKKILNIKKSMLGDTHLNVLYSMEFLVNLYDIQNRFEESEPLKKHIIETMKQLLEEKEKNPDLDKLQFAVDLNNYSLLLRKYGRLENAESNLQRALKIDEDERGKNHPKIAHRLMNLSIALIMQDKFDKAKQCLTRAWSIKQGNHDITSMRILFLQFVKSLFELKPDSNNLGQLKSLLTAEPLKDHADVSQTWDIDYFISFLGKKIPSETIEFLQALVNAMNDRSKVSELDKYEPWVNQPILPVDECTTETTETT